MCFKNIVFIISSHNNFTKIILHMERKGNINVTTENIFQLLNSSYTPIKKFFLEN